MAATDGTPETELRETDDTGPTISAYSTSKDRCVFTESNNDDGWIATDLTVEPER